MPKKSQIVTKPKFDLSAELANTFDGMTGVEEVPVEPEKIPMLSWGLSKLEDGPAIKPDQILDGSDSTVHDSVEITMIVPFIWNWRYDWDDREKRTLTLCESHDREVGTERATGRNLKCKGCQYAQWKDGYRPDCAEVYEVLAFNWRTNEPCKVRFKRTGLKEFKGFVKRHLKNKWKRGDSIHDLPMFATKVRLTAAYPDGKTYIVPKLEFLGTLHADTATQMYEVAKEFKGLNITGRTIQVDDGADNVATSPEAEFTDGEVVF